MFTKKINTKFTEAYIVAIGATKLSTSVILDGGFFWCSLIKLNSSMKNIVNFS